MQVDAHRKTNFPTKILIQIALDTSDHVTYRAFHISCKELFKFISEFNAKQIERARGFDKNAWEKTNFNLEIKNNPLLPLNILEILNLPCPFTEGKLVKDSFVLTLIPQISKVKLKEVALKNFLLRQKEPTNWENIHTLESQIIEDLLDDNPKSFWSLMSRKGLTQNEKIKPNALYHEDPKAIEVFFSVIAHPRKKEEWTYISDEKDNENEEISILCEERLKVPSRVLSDYGSQKTVLVSLANGSLATVYESANDPDDILENMQDAVVFNLP